MYDFAFSIPYGVFNIIGAIVGLVRTSHQAFVFPTVAGVLILALAVRSLKRFFRGKMSPGGVVVMLLSTCANTYVMHAEYEKTEIFHPAGFMALIGTFMIFYYCWFLSFGPGPLDPPPPYNPPKKEE